MSMRDTKLWGDFIEHLSLNIVQLIVNNCGASGVSPRPVPSLWDLNTLEWGPGNVHQQRLAPIISGNYLGNYQLL